MKTMHSRHGPVVALLLGMGLCTPVAAWADADCVAVPGIVGEIDSFLDQAKVAQGAGSPSIGPKADATPCSGRDHAPG